MCGRFQQGVAENGPCNEKQSQFITRRIHHELTGREIDGTKPNLRGHREEILLESENWTLPLWYLYCSA